MKLYLQPTQFAQVVYSSPSQMGRPYVLLQEDFSLSQEHEGHGAKQAVK